MRFSDHVTVNSLRKLDYINRRFSFLKDKVSFFPNIIDTIKFSPSNSIDNKLELNVCYVGRISPEKNLESLIYAVNSSLLKGYKFKFTIYGDQRNLSYYQKLLSLVNDLELNQAILFKGKSNNVLSIYHEADLICLVSFYEGFSNVISEAMACGVPILASDLIENEYLITHGENGFLANPNSIESISDCLDKFFSLSPNERAKIGIKNRAKAIEIFDSKSIFKDYMKLFKSL
nr:glycosyltransferase family 4 protein [Flavihumibacter fluminis]